MRTGVMERPGRPWLWTNVHESLHAGLSGAPPLVPAAARSRFNHAAHRPFSQPLPRSTETAPIAVLDLTIQGIDLHRSPGSGYTLVVRCGPHWASVAQPGVPLAFSAAARRDAGCSDGGEEGAAPAAAGGGGGGGGGTGGGAGRDAAGAPAAAEGNGGAPRPPQHSTSCSSIATQLAGVTAQPLQVRCGAWAGAGASAPMRQLAPLTLLARP